MNLDLSKFKKLECDNNCTTLQHPSGHQIKVAHKGISSTLRKQLDELPIMMAKGGFAKYSQKFDPNMMGAKGSGPSKSSNTMPGSPMMAKNNFTEPDAMGTSIPKDRLQQELHGESNPSMAESDVVSWALNKKAPPFGPLGASPKQHYPPCINPSCKSFGKSHPNCRCYGGISEHTGPGEAGYFAEGGEVSKEYYCDDNRMHRKGCSYYAEGSKNGPVGSEGDKLEQAAQEVNQNLNPDVMPDQDQINPNPVPPIQQSQAQASGPQPAPVPSPEEPDMNPNPEVAGQNQIASETQAPASNETITQQYKGADPSNAVHTAQATTAALHNEAQSVQQDYNNGHIQPKTYKDLFDDKDLPGKIGTIFGLIFGGAGAGLSHQPNMLMHMMDNEINRDLDAQQKSVTNKQNFMKLANETLLNKSQTTGVNLANQASARALGWSYAARGALHDQVQEALNDNNPVTRAQKMQVLSNMYNQVDQKEIDNFSKAGLATAIQESGGMNAQGPNNSPVNYNKINQLQRRSQQNLPGAPSASDLNNMTSEAAKLEQASALRQDFSNGFDQISKMPLKGRSSPNALGAVKKGLVAKLTPTVGEMEANRVVDSMMPQTADWGDTPSVKKQALGQFFNVLSAGTPTLTRFEALKSAQPNRTTSAQSAITSKGGREIVQKNGKWVYKK